jgi:prepilin-type N-terminal cleavage/methylation domain-containing protein
MKSKQIKGFTLIELLIVIAIVAVLAVVVILTLNPAELLKQARDSNRVSDMATLKSAISLYLADVQSPNLGTASNCYLSTPTGTATTTANCGVFASTLTSTTVTSTNLRKVDGTGWLPVNFAGISSGAPVGQLPVDPINNAVYYYAYAASSTGPTWQMVVAQMESTKYGPNGGANSVTNSDGGPRGSSYEIGSAPNLGL